MNEEELKIDPVDDHDPRYNLPKTALELANEKIRNLSAQKKIEEGVDVEVVDEKILHVRTDQDYKEIWGAFVEKEEKEFKKKMLYSADEIEKIGTKKFIDAMDWKKVEDVSKWLTDKVKIVICSHCRDGFAMFKDPEFTLCPSCQKLFNMKRIQFNYDRSDKVLGAETEEQIAASKLGFMIAFVYDKNLRDSFLIQTEIESTTPAELEVQSELPCSICGEEDRCVHIPERFKKRILPNTYMYFSNSEKE